MTLPKEQFIAKYGKQKWDDFIIKARNKYWKKKEERGVQKDAEREGLPTEGDRTLMKETIFGPLPEFEQSWINTAETSTIRQKMVDKEGFHMQRVLQAEWNRKMDYPCIITCEGRCNLSKARTKYVFELVTGKPYTVAQREWFEIRVKELEDELNKQ